MLKVTALIFVALSGAIMNAPADLLAERSIVFSGGSPRNDLSDSYFDLSIFIVTPPPPPPPFDSRHYPPGPNPRDSYTFPNLTEANIGESFTITASDDPGLFQELTDGDPYAAVDYRGSFPQGFGGSGGLFTPGEFKGLDVTSVRFTLNALNFPVDTASPENPYGYYFNGTITVDSPSVPEPSPLSMTTLGIALLAMTARRRRGSVSLGQAA